MFKMKASSPPGKIISASVPPHAVFGFESASDIDEKNGGLHLRKGRRIKSSVYINENEKHISFATWDRPDSTHMQKVKRSVAPLNADIRMPPFCSDPTASSQVDVA